MSTAATGRASANRRSARRHENAGVESPSDASQLYGHSPRAHQQLEDSSIMAQRRPCFASRLAALAPLALLAAPVPAAGQQQQATIHEWSVPWEGTRPRDPYLDRQGRVWFVGQQGHYVAMLDPHSGEFKKFDLAPGTGPHNLILDSTGIVWYAGNAAAHIGRLDPRDGSIRRYPMPNPAARDPHTLVWDRHGDFWFSVQGGNFVGKLTVATGDVRLVPMQTARARPYGIALDQSGRPWFVLFGTNKIGTVDPETFQLTEYPLPRAEARPRRMAITSDGAIWYGDYAGGMLGRFDPKTKRVDEWPLPGGPASRPYAMTVDDRDRVWVVETGSQPNRLVGFDARAHKYLPAADVPSGGGTIRNMVFDPHEHVIWFGSDANTIGRAQLPGAATTIP
jgi:virginiamycin B lyase